jgi:dsDNA-binding SOS-regulon protein
MSFPKPTKRAKPRAHKYNAVRTVFKGMSFPSKLEASVYAHHDFLQTAGEIIELKRYAPVRMSEAQISWQVDMSAINARTGEKFWVEAKGIEGSDYKVKKELWKIYGPGKLQIYKANKRGIYLAETIIPKEKQ